MTEIFLLPNSYPFSISLAIVFGLFLIEIISLIFGGSIMAIGSDAPDIDLDIDADFDLDLDTDIIAAPSNILGWLGVSQVPFLIWLVSFLTMFGLSGLTLQSIMFAIFSWLLPSSIASLIALIFALATARVISGFVAGIMPKTESSAMRKRFLGGHHGIISQGTARRGKPAEAKIKDRHGNTHYLRVEPFDDDVELEKGCSIHVIRKKDGTFYAIDIT
jgi:hypothetical protein